MLSLDHRRWYHSQLSNLIWLGTLQHNVGTDEDVNNLYGGIVIANLV